MPRQVTAVTRWVTWGWMGGGGFGPVPPPSSSSFLGWFSVTSPTWRPQEPSVNEWPLMRSGSLRDGNISDSGGGFGGRGSSPCSSSPPQAPHGPLEHLWARRCSVSPNAAMVELSIPVCWDRPGTNAASQPNAGFPIPAPQLCEPRGGRRF